MTHEPRRRSGLPDNTNAWQHGKRSAETVRTRKLSRATLKACVHLGIACGLFHQSNQPRPRPKRPDQIQLLRAHDPAMLDQVRAAHLPHDEIGLDDLGLGLMERLCELVNA